MTAQMPMITDMTDPIFACVLSLLRRASEGQDVPQFGTNGWRQCLGLDIIMN